ncbi:RipA family octameric membrane protein [Clostridium tagluense]|uniref:Thoeris protein ThsB TIR-like domain-containing protein n=1 Tax=Clostridium tagluense TaxID=360422 RepID=A0A401UI34_9CLOT|nr:TIR domain-containing protein [Clostridium tagluense]GCD09174.1 hypothetical protein Ctaglu_07970 [Clostridium tagluense]
MKVFLIHSFSDKVDIDKFIDKLKKYKKLKFVKLKYNELFKSKFTKRVNICTWKSRAKKGIYKSNFVIFIVGENSHNSKHIKWELRTAKKAKKKIYIVKLDDSFEVSDEVEDIKIITEEEFDNIIELELNINKKMEKVLFNKREFELSNVAIAIESKKILFDEYKLLLQTSENLIARRQIMNTFFLTANGVLISLFGLITGTIKSNVHLHQCTFAIVGALLCLSWYSLIISYGQLNTGKFAVLNKLEQYLPVSIFSAEWVALGEGKDKKIFRSFTKSEKKIPLLFLAIYSFLFLAIIFLNVVPIINAISNYYFIIRQMVIHM